MDFGWGFPRSSKQWMYSFLRNSLTSEQQLFKKYHIPVLSQLCPWLSMVVTTPTWGQGLSGARCWWHNTHEDVTNPIVVWGWSHPSKDSGTGDAAGRQAVCQVQLWADVFLAHTKAYFSFPPLPKPHPASSCLFLIYLRPRFDSTGQQSWTQDPVEIQMRHVNSSSASSGDSSPTVSGSLHFHKHFLRCILALTTLQRHLHKISCQLWKHLPTAYMRFMFPNAQQNVPNTTLALHRQIGAPKFQQLHQQSKL